jgi:hypothetical protein
MTISEEERQAAIKANEQCNKMFRHIVESDPTLRALFTVSKPRHYQYRYYTKKGSKDKYFYTVEKVNHDGKARYVSGVYKYISSKKQFKLIQTKGHAHKRDAIKRAQTLAGLI